MKLSKTKQRVKGGILEIERYEAHCKYDLMCTLMIAQQGAS
jgi:hypothetical protein